MGDEDPRLKDIIESVERYLAHLEYKMRKPWLWCGKRYLHAVSASWMRVCVGLQVFLEDPSKQYTPFMSVLDGERRRFADSSYYVRLLSSLSARLAEGNVLSLSETNLKPK